MEPEDERVGYDEASDVERTPRRSRRSLATEEQVKAEALEEGLPLEGDEGVTRCVCGSTDENLGLMIQCETCKCWQHCACMGMHTEEECPDVYYCEQCRPENHIDLLRALGFLASPKVPKRGASRSSRQAFVKESARELREARDAIRALAAENAARLLGENNNRSPTKSSAPKRRTMNSRDIGEGGWEQIPPGLLHDESEAHEDDEERKRKREPDTDEAEPAGGPAEIAKRRRTQTESNVRRREEKQDTPERSRKSAPAPREDKPRHPNQYTYRKQEAGAPPPRSREARRVVDSGSRQGTPLPDIRSTLPEHLSHLSYLMPPVVGDDTLRDDTAAAAERTRGPEPFALVAPIDPSNKVRFPQKRMTLGEMRKRVRTIGEYVTRVQIEAVEREKRICFLKEIGVCPTTEATAADQPCETTTEEGAQPAASNDEPPSPASAETHADAQPDAPTDVQAYDAPSESAALHTTSHDASGAERGALAQEIPNEDTLDEKDSEDAASVAASASAEADMLPISMQFVEQLTRDLTSFQRYFSGVVARADEVDPVS